MSDDPVHRRLVAAANPDAAEPPVNNAGEPRFLPFDYPCRQRFRLNRSLGEGPHIGQHVFALIFRKAGIPRRHIRFALMDRLEEICIGFLSGRRGCDVSRIRSTKKSVPILSALRSVTTGAVPSNQVLPCTTSPLLTLGSACPSATVPHRSMLTNPTVDTLSIQRHVMFPPARCCDTELNAIWTLSSIWRNIFPIGSHLRLLP